MLDALCWMLDVRYWMLDAGSLFTPMLPFHRLGEQIEFSTKHIKPLLEVFKQLLV